MRKLYLERIMHSLTEAKLQMLFIKDRHIKVQYEDRRRKRRARINRHCTMNASCAP